MVTTRGARKSIAPSKDDDVEIKEPSTNQSPSRRSPQKERSESHDSALPKDAEGIKNKIQFDTKATDDKASTKKVGRPRSKSVGEDTATTLKPKKSRARSLAVKGRERSDSSASDASVEKDDTPVQTKKVTTSGNLPASKRKAATTTKAVAVKDTSSSTSVTSKIVTISAEKVKHNILKKKTPKNELTNFIPGYTAALQLDSSSLKNQRPGLESLRKRALVTDKSTSRFIKGTLANQKQTKIISASTSSSLVGASFKKGVKRDAPNHAGDQWFGMVPTPLTDDVKRDLNVIRSRNYLDPKRFYKSSDKASKFMQVGTVIEGNAEYNSSRLTKKQRRSNLTEELMADPATAEYAKKKYKKMQQAKSATHKKQNSFKKRGKRNHA